jgi:hypothetical protein
MVMSRTPSGARASRMALITTAKAGVQPPSPPALMPNGLVGDKTSTIRVVKNGRLFVVRGQNALGAYCRRQSTGSPDRPGRCRFSAFIKRSMTLPWSAGSRKSEPGTSACGRKAAWKVRPSCCAGTTALALPPSQSVCRREFVICGSSAALPFRTRFRDLRL